MRRFLFISAVAAAVAGLAWAAAPGRAHACSLVPVVDLTPEFVRAQAERADLIVVGEAGAEWQADQGRASGDTPVSSRDERPLTATNGDVPYYSLVLVAAVLKGEAPAGSIDVGPSGFLGPDCSGGPRLELGQRVLLFLRQGEPPNAFAGETWSFTGPSWYALEDGRAHYRSFAQGRPDWDAAELVRLVAATAGSDPAQVEQAVRYARGEDVEMPRIVPLAGAEPATDPAPPDTAPDEEAAASGGASRNAAWAAAAAGAAVAVALAGLLARRRRAA
ncbi:MAG TPA: hypothetical protein VIO14_08105 [Dehalococcoidia bacterium]